MDLGSRHAGREPVRLVIWDLDDTLWRGTVTEGGIRQHVVAHYETVRELARRGIVSAICSKNDFDTIREILVGQGAWDFFVFPSIDWSAKGPRVREIVRAAQLRPETVLFIDDNASNRAEAAALVPGLQVAGDDAIAALLEDPLLAGRDDGALTRLGHYKLLEARRQEAGPASGVGDAAFLRESGIRVEIDHDVEADLDRCIELINRTNQLNFTKFRLPEDLRAARADLRVQLDATPGRRAAVVRVRDRFGDHGIVGFWMMDGIWVEPYLIHFTFSCRILGMGVEQWVYAKLGRPRLAVAGDVVSTLDFEPDWINATDLGAARIAERVAAPHRVAMRGGCELEVLRHFFSFRSGGVSSEFVFPRDGQTVWTSHAHTLFDQPPMRGAEGSAALRAIGFTPDDFASSFLDVTAEPACLVLSNSADAHVPLYRHRRLGLRVPVKLFGLDLSAPADEGAVARFCAANRLEGARAAAFSGWIRTLRRDWEPVPFAELDLPAAYERLARAVPPGSLLVVLLPITYANTAEGGIVTFPDQEIANGWMREVAARHDHISVVETADCLRSRDELRKLSHLHFARDVYHRIFERITAVHAAWRARSEAGGSVYTSGPFGYTADDPLPARPE